MAYINQYLKRYILKLNYCSYYNKFLSIIIFLFIYSFFLPFTWLNIDFSVTYYLFIYILFVNINKF